MINRSSIFFTRLKSLHGQRFVLKNTSPNLALKLRPLKTTSVFGFIGFASLSSLLLATPAYSFNVTLENADFENDFDSWTTVGDTSIQQNFGGQLQYENKQVLINTGCPNTATGRCFDQQNSSSPRNDDIGLSFSGTESSGGGYFNFSGNSQINADGQGYTGNFSSNLLQDFLGVRQNALHIPRENGTLANGTSTRTPKEGSAIRQTITVDNDFTLSFNWSFLSNDSNDSLYGDRDYGFVTIYNQNSDVSTRNVQVLADSSSALTNSNTSFTLGTSTGGNGKADYETYTTSLAAGTYIVGLGVVDVDGDERTSALLADEFLIEKVPFEFSPTLGLLSVAGVFGWSRLRRNKNKGNSTVG